MKITKETWESYCSKTSKQRQGRRMSEISTYVFNLREKRFRQKCGIPRDLDVDDLHQRLKTWKERKVELVERVERNALRDTLLRAARVARGMGLKVRSSKGRDGRVSSYYARGDSGVVRISDHYLPWSLQRQAMSDHHDGAEAFAGEVVIDKAATPLRLKRLIKLAEAGR